MTLEDKLERNELEKLLQKELDPDKLEETLTKLNELTYRELHNDDNRKDRKAESN